jgi:hypothetical protein
MEKKRIRKDEKREVTPEFVNMSKEILYSKFRVLQFIPQINQKTWIVPPSEPNNTIDDFIP